MKIEGKDYYLYKMAHSLQVCYDLEMPSFDHEMILYDADNRFLMIKSNHEKPFLHDGNPVKGIWREMIIGLPGAAPTDHGYSKTGIAGIMLSALYRYGHEVGITRAQADKMYYRLLKRVDFPLALAYYLVIRIFGRKFWGK